MLVTQLSMRCVGSLPDSVQYYVFRIMRSHQELALIAWQLMISWLCKPKGFGQLFVVLTCFSNIFICCAE